METQMTGLPALLAKIPDESKPMAALAIGSVMLVLVVLLHGAGIHATLVLHTRRLRRLRTGRPHLVMAVILFGWAVFLMLALHIAGFALWAYALLFLGLVPHAYDAINFAANAYTTLGFGNVDLTNHWRIIAPIIGISGLFTFAWTTSVLANIVSAHRELMDLLENERERESKMRSNLREEIWKNLQSERSAERAAKSEVNTEDAGASIFTRFRAWRELERRVKQLREASAAEILELRRDERANEERLGPGDVPVKSGEDE
jgi:hypothetical protein